LKTLVFKNPTKIIIKAMATKFEVLQGVLYVIGTIDIIIKFPFLLLL